MINKSTKFTKHPYKRHMPPSESHVRTLCCFALNATNGRSRKNIPDPTQSLYFYLHTGLTTCWTGGIRL